MARIGVGAMIVETDTVLKDLGHVQKTGRSHINIDTVGIDTTKTRRGVHDRGETAVQRATGPLRKKRMVKMVKMKNQ